MLQGTPNLREIPTEWLLYRWPDRWQRIYAMFPGRWASYSLPPVMKSAMKHLGIDLGDPARPYEPVTPWDHAQIGDFLRRAGLLQ